MKTLQEYIQDSINKIAPKITPEEKKEYENIFNRLMQDGMSLSEAVGLNTEMLENLYAYGYRLYNNGNYKAASLIFSFLTTLNSEEPKYFLSLGACYHMQKEYINAINNYMSAFYLNMMDPLPFYYISDCYIKLNKIDFAAFSLGLVMQLASKDPKYSKIRERAQLIQDALGKQIEEQKRRSQKVLESKNL